MDDARSQAVYINETGQRFDVAAAEYPGGPLVSCVQLTDFKVVPPSTDTDALPVKVLVAGMRSDGSPGVWEIHTDDSIDLPQPEQTDPSGARCIVIDGMTSLPSGIQIHLGWRFHTTAFSSDGRMIVGYADNPNGVTIGGVQILPGTTIGVYWRVYSLLGGRFCIVSAPHIIGSFTKQPLPAKWAAHWPGRPQWLQQLALSLSGTLQAFLVKATSVVIDEPQGVTLAAAESAGVYDVMGTDDDGVPALAKIDKSGNVTITPYVPDLNVSNVVATTSSGQSPAFTSDLWTVNATLINEGTAPASLVTVRYWLSTSPTLSVTSTSDSSTPTTALLDTQVLPALKPTDPSVTLVSPQQYSIDKLASRFTPALAGGTYYVVVTVAAGPQDGEIDLSDNVSQTAITVTAAQPNTTVNVDLAVFVPAAISAVPVTGTWNFNATVANIGPGTAGDSTLSYVVGGVTTTVTVKGPIVPGVSQIVTLSGKASDLTTTGGTVQIPVTITANSANVDTNLSNNTAVASVPVIYPEIVFDTYDPSGSPVPATFSNSVEVWDSQGALVASNDGATNTSRAPNRYYAYIDFKGSPAYPNGLPPGIYYIFVRASDQTVTSVIPYGIRALTAPSSDYSSVWASGPSAETASDQPLTSGPGVFPTLFKVMQLNPTNQPTQTPSPNFLERNIVLDPVTGLATGVNWIKLTLP